jgi:LysR family carnitine catabolism transcriptional activator
MNVSLANLQVFLQIAELGSFTAAARALDLSQPALSRTVRGMERRIGTRLFDRDTRKLTLTPAGSELRSAALRIIAEVEGSLSDFDDFLECRRGRITIAILPSVATALFPRAIKRFRALHPEVLIHVRDDSQNPVLDDVARGRADFAVTMEPSSKEEFQFIPLLVDELVLVAASNFRAQLGSRVTWKIFETQPFIAMSRTSSIRSMTDAAFRSIGLEVPPQHECGHPATAISLAAAGLGLAALPRLTLPGPPSSALTIRALASPKAARKIGIVTRAGQTPAPAVERLIKTLIEEAAKWPNGGRAH